MNVEACVVARGLISHLQLPPPPERKKHGACALQAEITLPLRL